MTDDEWGVSVVGAETLELTQRPGYRWGPHGPSTLGARACRRERVRDLGFWLCGLWVLAVWRCLIYARKVKVFLG